MLVPVDKILRNPEQPRSIFNDDALSELAVSMHTDGLLNPIVVEGPVDGYYVLRDGERRWRAARQLGWLDIEANVHEPSNDPQRLLVLALVGNLQREDMGPVDEGVAFAKLRASGLSIEEIAVRVGRSQPHVYERINLLTWGLSPASLDALNRRAIPIEYTMLRELGRLRADEQEKVVRRAIYKRASAITIRRTISALLGIQNRHAVSRQRTERIRAGAAPAVAYAGVESINGIGPALVTTCQRCGMAEDGLQVACKECPLVIFVKLYAEATNEH